MKHLFICFSFLVMCKSNSQFLLKVERPNDEISMARAGDVIISTSKAERSFNKNRVVYIFWRFVSADKKAIKMSYEEYYNNLKEKPDLKDEKLLAYEKEKNSFLLENFELVVYELKPDNMIYLVKRK